MGSQSSRVSEPPNKRSKLEQDITGQDVTGQDATGQDATGQDATGQDVTGQDDDSSSQNAVNTGPDHRRVSNDQHFETITAMLDNIKEDLARIKSKLKVSDLTHYHGDGPSQNRSRNGRRNVHTELFTEAGWNRLPYLVLVQVFQHLDQTDRYHAALTCKSWLLALSSPVLWRTGHFTFNANKADRALHFARKHGESLLHIKADCSELTDGRPHTSTSVVYQFLDIILQAGNQQLLTLSLTNMSKLWKSVAHPMLDVVDHIEKLLEHQQHLRLLDLSNAGLSVEHGVRLLQAASITCGQTIDSLSIHELINSQLLSPLDDIRTDRSFLSVMCYFSNLSDLQLSYDYLSDDLLHCLSETVSNSLQTMTIRANFNFSAYTLTSDKGWHQMTSACPRLKVIVYITAKGDANPDQYLCNILSRAIPLHELYLASVSWFTFISYRSFQHIADNFQKSLRLLDLSYDCYLDTNGIAKVIESCHKLELLSLRKQFSAGECHSCYKRMIQLSISCYSATPTCAITLNGEPFNLKETSLTRWV
ncbi:uncharacterized protein LOC131952554 isoform X2 [Physella acuta]|uniref:uncharacterized protein LOC131952554 isoform X2 n=1 Tax=Physella acuta TaxID=109671 RepID=UPI0027DCF095|nr:uncharacterized protein LOC131952554 isoform X2 [Physella acuta]